ncbi:hypothetical protein A3768_0956 [Ralstonia solanacearum]|nr:hypothetical protein F504_2547 [Ralstonia pseudosolanacearum FQY_4]ANH32126.1 hypothetical protein A3768_0956 [Ralstonia solanacearum]
MKGEVAFAREVTADGEIDMRALHHIDMTVAMAGARLKVERCRHPALPV